jgi:hypothetical protein
VFIQSSCLMAAERIGVCTSTITTCTRHQSADCQCGTVLEVSSAVSKSMFNCLTWRSGGEQRIVALTLLCEQTSLAKWSSNGGWKIWTQGVKTILILFVCMFENGQLAGGVQSEVSHCR